ncbi:hypothetical protein Bca4012_101388 [Brassica carinata]|uniref:Uncharacterized protein n=5 Tax=Brassica TaxID=3705 RepID=A0A0D3CZ57_BRAOL|nr:PREDICTED: uncharacterized protein LOC106299316 [Brassica oleracea var. oleracea]KAF2607195.1 hypothetical protein F2Q68_00046126 [Brassica cretica]KAF3517999.1 hypothetical protein DY000_02063403 [Brassica cretica]KAG2253680.1 hypothetical protein Bca52824_083816 [Brassica carinata]VDD63901.1 unnamed protein product [Brassica oleracea]
MEESGRKGDPFPGFEMSFHKDDSIFRRSQSCRRLQRRAPCPLSLPPRPPPSAEPPSATGVSTSALCQNGTDPIPLLSPLVLPSMLQPNPSTTSH